MVEIKDKFDIALEESDLFSGVAEIPVGERLLENLNENIPLAIAIHTGKARSEFIIAPILAELRRMLNHQISLFSGIDFSVDKEKGLTGICDYIALCAKVCYISMDGANGRVSDESIFDRFESSSSRSI